jgi:hypothetical protein
VHKPPVVGDAQATVAALALAQPTAVGAEGAEDAALGIGWRGGEVELEAGSGVGGLVERSGFLRSLADAGTADPQVGRHQA